VIVAIDEDSMASIQQWPWPRDELARIVRAGVRHGARAMAFDLILDQPDPQSPGALSRRFDRSVGYDPFHLRRRRAAAGVLSSLKDTDNELAREISSATHPDPGMSPMSTIMPVAGVPPFEGINPDVECAFNKPSVVLEPATVGIGTGFPSADIPLLLFREAGARLAAIDFAASDDFVVRRVKAVQRICDAPFLLLGVEAIAAAGQGFFTTVQETMDGLRIHLDIPGAPETISFPTERDGSFWLHYGPVGVERPDGTGRKLGRYISAQDLLDPDFDSSRVAGKIVLVAVIDLGRIDERRSPLDQIIYGVEAHMQMIEQIVDQDFLRRPWFMFAIETFLMGAFCLLIIVLVPFARPTVSVVAIASGVVILLGASVIAFPMGLLLDTASVGLGSITVAIGVLATTLIERDRARLSSEIELQSERADRAALAGELEAAARIQTTLLPPVKFEVPGRLDLAAYIDPARTVGGDFFDHFLVDDRHLFFLVADVSGKGADASQFMLLSKTLWKSVALRTRAPLEQIQAQANSEITRENKATMFVTGLCGLLDLETGRLSYSSAGHDSPYLFGSGRMPKQLEAFAGPPAGLVDEMDYPVGHVDLGPGDRLCIFTDGVTEAMDRHGVLFGLERLEAALGTAPPDLDSSGLVQHVVGQVRGFADDAEQSDDLTLMIISIPG
jgi:serine phosphatase RsbU (regulator of sigma subunit)